MKVCLAFTSFGMLRQSSLTPSSPHHFDPSHHTCRGDIIVASLGLFIVVRWSKTIQTIGRSPVVTSHKPQPTPPHSNKRQDSVSSGNTYALNVLLEALHVDNSLFSLHSLRWCSATAAYRAGIDQIHIKHHGIWANKEFWSYITSPCVSDSLMWWHL